MKYRAEIDGLRALAVLPVILFHAGFELFSGGFVGVDIFFVISGYLITTIIISEMAEGNFSMVNFYERRARRILPALFFVMLMCLPFALIWLPPFDLKDFGQSLVVVSIFSSNILFWIESGYFDTAAEIKPLLHTWSLAVEEQFYIGFPLLLMMTWRIGIKWLLILLSILFVVSLGFAHWGASNLPAFTFYMILGRFWELLVGVFIAFYFHNNTHLRSQSLNQIFSLLGFGLIVYSVIIFDQKTPFPSLYTLVPTIGTGLILLSAVPNTIVHRLLSFPLMVQVGLISYSLYLWHQPMLAFARNRILGEVSDFLIIGLLFVSLIMAYISWRWVEKPFRDKKKISRKKIFSFSLIGILMFVFIGSFIHLNGGFYERLEKLNNLDIETISNSPYREKCHTRIEPCEYFGDSIEWASFGDSHLVEITYAMSQALSSNNIGIQHNTYSGCKPTFNDDDWCAEWTSNTLERLVRDKNIRNVIISHRLTWYLYGDVLGKYPSLPNMSTEEEKEKIWEDLLKILQKLIDADKNVYLILQVPELPFYIQKIAFWSKPNHKVIGVSRDWWKDRYEFVYTNLDSLPDSVKVIDPIDIFCDAKLCYGSDINGYLYFDDNHVSLYGAKKIVSKIFAK